MLLSAAMIVRNEERHLAACLASIRDIVDEVVIVDTGSTDRTTEIAQAFGARLHTFEWTGDFSAARNEALRLSHGEWILYIDADEHVRADPRARARLQTLLRKRSLVGCYVLLYPHTGFTGYWEMRLFRNDRHLRYEGAIHENIWPAITSYRERCGGGIGYSELVLDHAGYEGDQQHKHERNRPLLEAALRRDPEHVYCWYHLGVVYRGLGLVPQAREALQSGIAAVRRKTSRNPQDILPYVELMRLDLAEGAEFGALLREAKRLFPRVPVLAWLEGQALLREGRFREAASAFEQVLKRRKRAVERHELGYNERLFDMLTYEPLATCYFKLEQYAKSRQYFELAERCEPDRFELRIKRQLSAELEGTRT